MIAKILEKITGKDDLERVAYKDNLRLLNDYLQTRRRLVRCQKVSRRDIVKILIHPTGIITLTRLRYSFCISERHYGKPTLTALAYPVLASRHSPQKPSRKNLYFLARWLLYFRPEQLTKL